MSLSDKPQCYMCLITPRPHPFPTTHVTTFLVAGAGSVSINGSSGRARFMKAFLYFSSGRSSTIFISSRHTYRIHIIHVHVHTYRIHIINVHVHTYRIHITHVHVHTYMYTYVVYCLDVRTCIHTLIFILHV